MQNPKPSESRSHWLSAVVVVLIAGIAVALLSDLPARLGLTGSAASGAKQDDRDDHDPHDHGPGSEAAGHGGPGHTDDGHSDGDAIALSKQARRASVFASNAFRSALIPSTSTFPDW